MRWLVTVLFAMYPVVALGADDAPPRLRVLTYNIHHGEGVDGKFDLERIAKLIKDAKADVVALQEVDVKTKRAAGVDQAGELGRLTGMHHVFGKALDFSGGGYGIAILSRWPIEKPQTHALPSSPGREPRAALAAAIRMGEKGPVFTFISTHLDHTGDNTDRLAQCRKLNELFGKEDAGPAILAGDLNAQPKNDEIKSLLEKWTSAAAGKNLLTFPSGKPTIEIDHILLRPAKRWRVVEVAVIEEKVASDHRPVLAVVELVQE